MSCAKHGVFCSGASCAPVLLSVHVGLHPMIFILSSRFMGKEKKVEKALFQKGLCGSHELAHIPSKDVWILVNILWKVLCL